MSRSLGGLKRVGYSDTKTGTITWLTGKPTPDSDPAPEGITTETTDGNIFGGSQIAPTLSLLDRADFDTLEGFVENGTEKFWHLEYFDGRTYVTRVAMEMSGIVDPMGTNARDGVTPITLTGNKLHTKANVFELVV